MMIGSIEDLLINYPEYIHSEKDEEEEPYDYAKAEAKLGYLID